MVQHSRILREQLRLFGIGYKTCNTTRQRQLGQLLICHRNHQLWADFQPELASSRRPRRRLRTTWTPLAQLLCLAASTSRPESRLHRLGSTPTTSARATLFVSRQPSPRGLPRKWRTRQELHPKQHLTSRNLECQHHQQHSSSSPAPGADVSPSLP